MRTQNNFNKTRIINAHIDRLIGVAINIPSMGLEKGESSETHVSTFSKYPVVGLKTPKSFWSHVSPFSVNPFKELKTSVLSLPEEITFSVFESTVIYPFSVIVFLAVPIYAKDSLNSRESGGSVARESRLGIRVPKYLDNGRTQSTSLHPMLTKIDAC